MLFSLSLILFGVYLGQEYNFPNIGQLFYKFKEFLDNNNRNVQNEQRDIIEVECDTEDTNQQVEEQSNPPIRNLFD